MKASELIKNLQGEIEKHGDQEVLVINPRSGNGDALNVEGIAYNENMAGSITGLSFATKKSI